jgi:hypothetical protein
MGTISDPFLFEVLEKEKFYLLSLFYQSFCKFNIGIESILILSSDVLVEVVSIFYVILCNYVFQMIFVF